MGCDNTMDYMTSIFIALGLAMDSFTVSLGIGTGKRRYDRRGHFRLIYHFGLFQAAMTALGWFAGNTIVHYIRAVDHWIALGLLLYVGGNMIRTGLNPEAVTYQSDPSRGKLLVLLSIATSIDAMAVGLSLAVLNEHWLIPVIIIGVVTWCLSSVGLLAGNHLGKKFGKKMEILGGTILIFIGLRVVITHVFLGLG